MMKSDISPTAGCNDDYHRLLEILETYAKFCGLWVKGKLDTGDFKIGLLHFIEAVDAEILRRNGESNG